MNKLMFALCATIFGAAAYAQQPATVLVVNINNQMVSFLRGAGFNSTNPYAEVLIVNASPAADGYRIHVTYTDASGVQHDLLRDSMSQATGSGVVMEIFSIDAVTISATATPYKLQPGATASTP